MDLKESVVFSLHIFFRFPHKWVLRMMKPIVRCGFYTSVELLFVLNTVLN